MNKMLLLTVRSLVQLLSGYSASDRDLLSLGGGKTAELHLAIPWGETNSKRSVPLTQSCGTDSGRAMASLACSNRVPKGPVAGGNVIHPILS